MLTKRLQFLWIVSGCAVLLFSHISSADISPVSREKIENAVPQHASAIPDQPRKILVTSLHVRNGEVGMGHASIPYGQYALKQMGERTGAFEAVFSNDTLMFKKEQLQQFDAICFLNTAGVLFTDPELRMNLLDFVSQGGGFIGIHAAGATFVQWPEYWQFPAFGHMLGAYEDGGHPWGPEETIYLQVEEPDHPLTQMFDETVFPIQDEVFQFRAPYSRDNLRILLSIDTDKTDMNPDRRFLPERYSDKDFAMSWIREYGKGRVFYTSLGHNSHIYWNAPVLEHMLSGIQYALGDVQADATPSNQITQQK